MVFALLHMLFPKSKEIVRYSSKEAHLQDLHTLHMARVVSASRRITGDDCFTPTSPSLVSYDDILLHDLFQFCGVPQTLPD